jgi:hypothetical protein
MACPICLEQDAQNSLHNTLYPARQIACRRCGAFGISQETIEDAEGLNDADRWRISAWICEYSPRLVRWEDIEQALAAKVPGLLHRADRMLAAINYRHPGGNNFSASDEYFKLVGTGWNRNPGESRYLLEKVLGNELSFVELIDDGACRVTPKGLLHLEGRGTTTTAVGFCAMWFREEVAPLWTSVIEPATRLAGYEPLRIDGKQHNGKIDDEIMASIRGSRFVVADFTGNRGGVYYEAGFAHGLGLPVIFMCREGDDLHFDIRQYNCIFWKPDGLEDAQQKLKNRILATLGQGPLKLH